MGYYINTDRSIGRAAQIVAAYGGRPLAEKPRYEDIADDEALIVVVHNEIEGFEAAAYAYNKAEFFAFTHPSDQRRKEYMIMNKQQAEELSGFSKIDNIRI